jgi:hypothetical protein
VVGGLGYTFSGGVPLFCAVISIFLTPYQNPDVFERQHQNITKTIGVEHEFLCTLLGGDSTFEWYREYTSAHGIRTMVVPHLGVVNLVNVLAARAAGKHLLYISDIVDILDTDTGWGERALAGLEWKDGICGAILSSVANDQNCTGLLLPIRTFHVLGYYCCPIFETPVYGYRWNASILTELDRLVNIPCGIQYASIGDSEYMERDRELYGVTRQARVVASERLQEFMGN